MTAILTDEEIKYAKEVLRQNKRRRELDTQVEVDRMTARDGEQVRRPEGRPKGLKHTEESKARMSVKRRARTQPRNATSGRFVKEG